MSVIRLDGVTKYFGKKAALDGVSAEFETGRIYGLLGRNGAGKSTLINSVCNRVRINKGEISLDGERLQENDKALGHMYAMSEGVNLPGDMRISSAFKVTGDFYPNFDNEYAGELAKRFGLDVKKRLGRLSTGYRTIAKIIIALSSGAEFIFLDEPVLGLDANHRELFYRLLVERFIDSGCCMVVSTHLIDECANLFEHVIIIDKGKVICSESAETLLNEGCAITGSAAAVDRFCKDMDILSQSSMGGIKSVYVRGRPESVPNGLEISKPDMQQIFVSITGGQEGEGDKK